MKTDIQGAWDEPANDLEDAEFRVIFPWRCGKADMHTSQDFKNLEEASNVTGIEPSVIEDAVLNHDGHVGDLVFVKQ